MKHSVIALLLIFILVLSGCKVKQEAGTATPAERVEAETEQESSQTVPDESETEQKPPIEEEKPDEQEKPVEQEKPAKESEDSEIVKFWETVPEMSPDEAKEVVRTKLERIRNENKIGTLTDEERMALYVLNMNEFERVSEKYPLMQSYYVKFIIYLEESFTDDASAYCESHKWENQEVTNSFSEDVKSVYRSRVETKRFSTSWMCDITKDYSAPTSVPYSGSVIHVEVSPNEEVKENFARYANGYKEILRYYLSLKTIAFCRGPEYPVIESYD